MNSRSLTTALLGLVLVSSACHNNTPPPVGPKQPDLPPPVVQPPPPQVGNNTNTGTNSNVPVNIPVDRIALLATMSDPIHFDYDMADIKSEDAARLDRKAAIMRANPNLKIRIIGNADERGSDSYNITLGMKRAVAARDYLVKAGANTNNIELASLGRESPVDPASNEEAWRKNRRDEFEITAGGQTIVAPRP